MELGYGSVAQVRSLYITVILFSLQQEEFRSTLEWGGKVGSHVNLVVDDFQTFPKNGGRGPYFVTAKVSEDQSCPLRDVAAQALWNSFV